jgi:hypothetical protein
MTRPKSIEKTPAPAQLELTAEAPIVAVSPSLAQLLARAAKGKVRQIDLARFLAATRTFYVAFGTVPTYLQGASTVPVPVEVLDIVGEFLVGRSKWAAIQNEARARAKGTHKMRLQQQADEVWRHNPDLSNTAVAQIIAPPGKVDTVRRLIKNPGK